MSRAAGQGSFAGYFPQNPSVQKRKRAAANRDKDDAMTSSHAAPATQSDEHKRRRTFEPTGTNDSAGDAGDVLIGTIGSASSTSTVSSVFSNGLQANHHGATPQIQTPLTVDDFSPPRKSPSPRRGKSRVSTPLVNGHCTHPMLAPQEVRPLPTESQTSHLSPQTRVRALPAPGEVRGERVYYDPQLDPKYKSLPDKKPKYKAFGSMDTAAPPDPRLAIPGYKDGNLAVRLRDQVKIWKNKPRAAPYNLAPYPWNPAVSIGSGPPTAVVVTGFDPFTSEPQIRAQFGSYGDIAALENKTDPNTGTFLGICWIRYRDTPATRTSRLFSAVDAAKRAEKDGNNQRLGLRTVRVERDRVGKRCKRYVENVARRHEERRAKERQAEETHIPAKINVQPPNIQSQSEALPTPPPNAPKGPSIKPSLRPPEGPRAQPPSKSSVYSSLIESEPILPKIKRRPYLFIPESSVPVQGTTISHLKKRMKAYDWRDVRLDQTGYYVLFEDSKRGEDEALRCFQGMNKQAMFTYTMDIECQRYGNPNYERSPSPERAMAIKKKRDEEERMAKEEQLDWEEEKHQRALNLDPASAALEQLRTELRDRIMTDVKSRIAAPALSDFLDPARHVDKRRKLGIADPTQQQPAPALLGYGDVTPKSKSHSYNLDRSGGFRKYVGHSSLSLSRHNKDRALTTVNVFADERRTRPTKKKPEALPLHRRLQYYGGDESDEDEHVSKDDSKEASRSISRFSSVALDINQTSQQERKQDVEESVRGDESGDEDFGIAKTVLDPHLLKKDPVDMALQELHLFVNTLPFTSKLHKHAKRELSIRKRKQDDDRLFQVKAEDVAAPSIEDIVLPDVADSATPDDSADMTSSKRKSKNKKKSKKQIFEEREAAKAATKSSKSLIQEDDTSTPEALAIENLAIEKLDQHEEEEEQRAEVEWGVSTDIPRRTVEDDPDLVMDLDGWQHLIKDDEDLKFLKEALSQEPSAQLANPTQWAIQQKELKCLNNGDVEGVTHDRSLIKGYYVSNSTGSARSEGIHKILESEKSMYLPHRIKVALARERRQAQHKEPVVSTEDARKAKLASTKNSRSTRANNRTHLKDLNTAKQNLNVDGQPGEAMRFNQLKKRKKLVKFERSAIHGWGLYADENIAVNDMIIEYVGEIVRQAVANVREARYDKQGMGSSYLFRIDDDAVIDATKKGGIARFINHSCAPNCTAKIIKVDGSRRIVIYALKEIAKDEELTYDYKFERELNSNDRIPCLCGSDVCKGYLN